MIEPIPVFLDTDIGDDIDDAIALTMMLASPEISLRAVGTCSGDPRAKAQIVRYLLEANGRGDIPVAPGFCNTLRRAARTGDREKERYYDAERMGDIAVDTARDALDLLVETADAYAGKLVLLAIGPLTNVAIALIRYPELKEKLARIVLMGGAFFQNRSEWNILCDPEAAEIVFSSGVPITAAGLDVTEKCRIAEADMKKIRAHDSQSGRALAHLYHLWQRALGGGDALSTLHDPLAAALVFRPDFCTMRDCLVTVETAPSLAKGMTYNVSSTRWYHENISKKSVPEHTVQAAETVRADDFIRFCMERILRL